MSKSYYTSTRNPIARAGVIRALMDRGYNLYEKQTVSTYFTKYPAADYPFVFVRQVEDKWYIDLGRQSLPHWEYFSPVTFKGVPTLVGAPITAPTPAPVLANPAKYEIEYQKANGQVGNYTISNPIEANTDEVKCYAFNRHAVRTFKRARIRKLLQIM